MKLKELVEAAKGKKIKVRRAGWPDKNKWFKPETIEGKKYRGPSSTDPDADYDAEKNTDWVSLPKEKFERFSVADLDDEALGLHNELIDLLDEVEEFVTGNLPKGRARAKAIEKLEEAYLWAGKAIRVDLHERS